MKLKIRLLPQLITIFIILVGLAGSPAAATPSPALAAPLAAGWCAAGSFQGWNNASDILTDDGKNGDLVPGDGIYSLSNTIAAAGSYEFKITSCGSWDASFPPDNAWFVTGSANQAVTFTFDSNNYSADAGVVPYPRQNIVNVLGDSMPPGFTAVGNFQSEDSSGGDWDPSDPNTALTPLGNGWYHLAYTIGAAGNYEGKVTNTGGWSQQFTLDGRVNNDNKFQFTTTSASDKVYFLLDIYTGRMTVSVLQGSVGSWCVIGINGDWGTDAFQLYDDGSNGDLVAGDGIFSKDVTYPIGRQEFKVRTCGDWSTNYPASNSWFYSPGTPVKVTFDTNDRSGDAGWNYIPDVNVINVIGDASPSYTMVGDFQGWNNANPATLMSSIGSGLHYLALYFNITGGKQGKVVSTGTWDAVGNDNRSVAAADILFTVANAGDGKGFIFNTRTGRLAIEAAPTLGHAQDNNVEYAGLAHNSQDALYRVPFGAINPGDELVLRLRSFHNDLTRVRVRFWDTAAGYEFFQDMSVAAGDVSCYDAALDALDESCDFWQLKYTPPVTTTLYYRFIAIDGTSTAYYEDDNFKDGGWGQALAASVDNSYVVTVYDPAFQPEQWMKDAVIYQIFPDRFFNGDPGNDPTGFEPRYNYPNGTDPEMDQIILKGWGDLPEGYCRGYTGVTCPESPRGRDYFGGDLKGIHDKLDYLEALGVTVIYLNPVFEAGSNHLYDTQDYRLIEKFFGDNDQFVALADDAHARGMKIILDGVFNHVSSDSIYMDRYGRYSAVGACEDTASPYRDWFTFHDVTPGTGHCVSSTGVPDAATYDSWWGFDSIPVLNKNNPAVVDLIYAANDAIARYWLGLGADGWRLDVMPDASFPPGFWQHFRQVVLDAKPDAVILGELWKKAEVLPYIYGDTADSTMNYRFRNAIQGFFGTVDYKGFYDDGQTDQPPSLFARKMLSQREDYPDGAYFTLMNLLTSHDTRRILWTLTPGANNPAEKELDLLNLAVGKQRLKLALVVQMTVPGAPTIYYGDEVGVNGDDDPDDRRTFPWADAYRYFFPLINQHSVGANLPVLPLPVRYGDPAAEYYGALGDHDLLDWTRQLTALRHANPVFKDGELTFLLTDDPNRTLAYLMRTPGSAALVAINRDSVAHDLPVDISGYLPAAVLMQDALGGIADVTAVSGTLTVTLPGMTAAVLLPAPGTDLTPPPAPTALVAAAGNGLVDLTWSGAADNFKVYRSPVTGGGYVLLGETTGNAYSDTTVENGRYYYYVVRGEDVAGNLGPASNEASALPFYPIGWAGLISPSTIAHTLGVTPTVMIYGQVYVPGVTDNVNGSPASILAQVGFGATASDPSAWTTWVPMTFNTIAGSNFEYMGSLRPEQTGTFDYLVRFSTDLALSWTYGYLPGSLPGVLTVTPNPDTTPPSAPLNMRIADWSSASITLAWDAIPDAAEYWLYRSLSSGVYADPLIKATAPITTYTDLTVDPGNTYYYVVRAVDAALNQSSDSNEVFQKAEPRIVNVTFKVKVPDFTPPGDTIYIAGGTLPLEWNPGNKPMTYNASEGVWEITLQFLDGTNLLYKYTRGSWERVEWWGTITKTANRQVTINSGVDGNQTVSDTLVSGTDDNRKAVQNWRDPLVSSTVPANGFSGAAPTEIVVNFSREIKPLSSPGDYNTAIVVSLLGSPVAGVITPSSGVTSTLTWTPTSTLAPGIYTVTVFNVRTNLEGDDSVLMQVAYVFTFTVVAP